MKILIPIKKSKKRSIGFLTAWKYLGICPGCFKPKSDKTIYAHNKCWGQMESVQKNWLIKFFGDDLLGRKTKISLDKDWKKTLHKGG